MGEGESGGAGPILACVSHSPRLGAVAREAWALGALLGLDVRFVHAGTDTATVREPLEAALSEAGVPDPGSALEIRKGSPVRVVEASVHRLGASLVLAGALEREGMMEGVMGSVARRLAKELPCAVLLSISPCLYEQPWRRIVMSVRTGETGETMAGFGADLARRAKAERLDFIWEYDPFREAMGTVAAVDHLDTGPFRHEAEARQKVELANFLERLDLRGLDVRSVVRPGREGVEASRYAAEIGAELVIALAPTRRLTAADRFFRHRTIALLDRLPCSVLLYRPGLALSSNGGEAQGGPAGTGEAEAEWSG